MPYRYLLKYVRANEFRRSRIEVIDQLTHEKTNLHMEQHIGHGGYGTVRLFTSQSKALAVKSTAYESFCNNKSSAQKLKRDIKKEYALTKLAYPNEGYLLKTYSKPMKATDDSILFDYRLVMPYIPGATLNSLSKEKYSYHTIAKLVLRIAQELLRIHSRGVIHGDIQCGNIIYQRDEKDLKITFIDFGLANRIGEPANVDFLDIKYLAPERALKTQLPAHPLQDIYSLAKLIASMLEQLKPNTRMKLLSHHPSIELFIKNASNITPNKRPDLVSLIHDLATEILSIESKSKDDFDSDLLIASFTQTERLTDIITAADNQQEVALINHLESLINHHFHTEATKLLDLLGETINHHKHHTLKLISTCFANKHLPTFIFTQLIHSLSDRFVRENLMKHHSDSVSPLQLLVKNNRRDLIDIFYTQLSHRNIFSWPSVEDDIVTSLEIEQLSLAIDLSTYIATTEYHLDKPHIDNNIFTRSTHSAYQMKYVVANLLLNHAINKENPSAIKFTSSVILKQDDALGKLYERTLELATKNNESTHRHHA